MRHEDSACSLRPFKNWKREIVDEFERRYLTHLLHRHGCNLKLAERRSGLSRRQFRYLLQKHGLSCDLGELRCVPPASPSDSGGDPR